MRNLIATLWAESLKVRRSKALWITILAFLIFPLMGGFLMFVSKNPDLALKYGLIGTKARLFGTANWTTYIGFLSEMMSAGGLVLFGFVTSWVFGREYSERTVKDLLALPSSRSSIVISKFIVIFFWCLILTIFFIASGLLIGFSINLTGWTGTILSQNLPTLVISAILTILLCTPIAFFASVGKGYLTPMGILMIVVIFSQIIASIGYGMYFPWAIPALYSGIAGTIHLGMSSYIILYLTSIIGFFGTLIWWRYADQK